MGGTGFQSAESICDSATSIVVEMGFNITVYDTSEHTDKLIDLAGRSALQSVSPDLAIS